MTPRLAAIGLFVLATGVMLPAFAQSAAPLATASAPASTTAHSATKSITMKPISAAEETSYAAALETRAQAVLDDLKPIDDTKADHVKKAVIAQYRALRAWHDTYDDDLKTLNKNATANADAIAQIQTTRTALHNAFLSALAKDLTEAQVEIVKDRMTYGTVKVTYDEYLRQNPTLTADQKSQILSTLKEARELAMDDGSQQEKAATFGKYKGRINNLLAAWKKQAATQTTSAPASNPTTRQ